MKDESTYQEYQCSNYGLKDEGLVDCSNPFPAFLNLRLLSCNHLGFDYRIRQIFDYQLIRSVKIWLQIVCPSEVEALGRGF